MNLAISSAFHKLHYFTLVVLCFASSLNAQATRQDSLAVNTSLAYLQTVKKLAKALEVKSLIQINAQLDTGAVNWNSYFINNLNEELSSQSFLVEVDTLIHIDSLQNISYQITLITSKTKRVYKVGCHFSKDQSNTLIDQLVIVLQGEQAFEEWEKQKQQKFHQELITKYKIPAEVSVRSLPKDDGMQRKLELDRHKEMIKQNQQDFQRRINTRPSFNYPPPR